MQSSGWSVYADVPGKPGLITNTTGAALVVPFHVPRRCQVTVTLDMLKSYAHMGTFRATVVHVATNMTVASNDVDCLWTEPVSIDAFEYLKFTTTEDGAAYKLRVSVTSVRSENKVKLMGVAVTAVN